MNIKLIYKVIQFIYFFPFCYLYFKYLRMKLSYFRGNIFGAIISICVFELFVEDSEINKLNNILTKKTLLYFIIAIVSEFVYLNML